MKNIYPLIITFIAGFATILGNILLFIDVKYKNKLISFSMGLSFIVMFLISIIELIPDGLLLVNNDFSIFGIFVYGLILLLIGYIIVFVIDRNIVGESSLYKIGILSMLSLFVHNVPEGVICALTSSNNLSLGLKMSFIIMIHNIPEGICISLPIYYSTGSRGKAFFMTIISSMGEVFGALFSIIFLNNFINDFIMSIILIITGGIMISLSVLKILKEGISYKCYKWLIMGIIFGIIIIIISL
ncbi:MAG: ZIP family metal transporter [Candidatus Coprovivens sp.]